MAPILSYPHHNLNHLANGYFKTKSGKRPFFQKKASAIWITFNLKLSMPLSATLGNNTAVPVASFCFGRLNF